MMREIIKKVLSGIAVVLLLAGMAVLLYPQMRELLYGMEVKRITSDFSRRMEETNDSGDNWDWLKDLMVQYNKELYESGQDDLVDAFSYQQVDFSLKRFGFDEEMIGYITIPRMEMELPIYLGANLDNLSKGAAQLTQTSLPVGGINTNAVIAAHRGYRGTSMFQDIEELETGDLVMITNFQETLYYQVAEIKVIDPSDIQQIFIQEGRDLVTLITCHPYRNNYQRYVVYCERTENQDDVTNETGNGWVNYKHILSFNNLSSSQKQILIERLLPVVILALLLIIGIIWMISWRKRKRR